MNCDLYDVMEPYKDAPWWPVGLVFSTEGVYWCLGQCRLCRNHARTLIVGAAVEWMHENEQTFVPAIYKAPTLVESAMLECEAVAAKLIIVWKGSHATNDKAKPSVIYKTTPPSPRSRMD